MKVPGAQFALVEERKVRLYLLAPVHPQGAAKARFFATLGFHPSIWRQLAAALRRHVGEHDYQKHLASPYGVKYIVRGPLRTPAGASVELISIWIVEHGRKRPRFVTAYPGGKK